MGKAKKMADLINDAIAEVREEPRDKLVQLRVTASERAEIVAVADALNLSLSEYLRAAHVVIRDDLKRRRKL